MKEFKLQLAKGFRDFPPNEKILRDNVISKIKEVFEVYGFSPLETPTIERLDVLTVKFGAGEASDIVGELYQLKDQGGRELGLRYEFTFALARYMGMNPQIKLPFKRYQIGPVFRDGPIKAGRYREFYQCDVDIVGAKDVIADAEIISLISDVFKKLELDINIEVNDRKLLEDILNFVEIPKENQTTVIISLDKFKKIGKDGVKKELLEKEVSVDKIEKILKIISVAGTNQEKLNKISGIIGEDKPGVIELKKLFEYLSSFEVDYIFLPSLARGLGYYTGPIYEVFLKDESIMSSSLAGGGRWDKMIGKYIGNEKQEYPANGVAIGLEPTMEVIKARDGMDKKTTADLFIIPIGNVLKDAIRVVQELRREGVNVSIDLLKRNIGKNIDYADKLGMTYVGFLGENEIKEKMISIKNIKTGKKEKIPFEKVKDSLLL